MIKKSNIYYTINHTALHDCITAITLTTILINLRKHPMLAGFIPYSDRDILVAIKMHIASKIINPISTHIYNKQVNTMATRILSIGERK